MKLSISSSDNGKYINNSSIVSRFLRECLPIKYLVLIFLLFSNLLLMENSRWFCLIMFICSSVRLYPVWNSLYENDRSLFSGSVIIFNISSEKIKLGIVIV